MSETFDRAVSRIRKLPKTRQDQAAVLLDAFARRTVKARPIVAGVPHVLSDEEVRLIDEAIAEADAGRFVTAADMDKIFAKYRR